jgi:hypothetical protein
VRMIVFIEIQTTEVVLEELIFAFE